MDIRTIAKDPDFQKLPIEEQRKAFVENDPDFAALPPAELDKAVKELMTGAVQAKPQPKQSDGYLNRMNNALVRRGVNISDELQPKSSDESIGQTLALAPRRALRVTGQAAGLLGDVMGETVSSAAKGLFHLLPESKQAEIKDSLKEAGREFTESAPGKLIVKGAQKGMEAYQGFKKENPEAAKDVEAAINIATILPAGKAASIAGKGALATGKEGANIGKDLLTIAKRRTPGAIDKEMSDVIETGINKAVRPSVFGKSNANLKGKYFDNAKTAVQEIVSANPEKLPKSLDEFSTSIRATKNKIYDQYSQMATQAGEKGAMVDLTPIIKEMEEIGSNPQLRRVNSGAADKILARAEEWKKHPTMISPSEAEDMIAAFNAETKNFWKNPNLNDTHSAAISERIAKKLRTELNNSVENYSGPGYRDLKRKYGALTAIEKEVTDRATVDARKNIKGFFDLADIASTGEFVLGLARMEPSYMLSAAAMRGAKEYIKHLNNPNRIVKNMFGEVEKLMKARASEHAEMKSKLGRALQGKLDSLGY